MSKLACHTGIAVPLDVSNVDTDVIIPKQFLQKITKLGFGKHLFHDWRYLEGLENKLNVDFVLNQDRYKNSTILLTRENFGCGSSREHAVWALLDFGIKVVISSSFADIFYSNSIKNGLLPITFSKNIINYLFKIVVNCPNMLITVNLVNNEVLVDNQCYKFKINYVHKYCILNGLDDVDLTLNHIKKIENYENSIPKFLNPFNSV
ncbi:MAG: 3-isopropylmalate dehydratase small subunit [Buchnera aphidicola (Schlechtendalia peitan)]